MHKHCQIKRAKCTFCFHSGMKTDGTISKEKVAYCAKQYGENDIRKMLMQGVPCPEKKRVRK